jgi:hypothetical protein
MVADILDDTAKDIPTEAAIITAATSVIAESGVVEATQISTADSAPSL